MASHSLYRKYRPQRFAELVGQEHVTVALRNAVREDRVGHAYLFSGPRGTGKTTTARILARALNCLQLGDDGEPCGACENCEAVAAGTFYDLVERDAASNRGIDAMRELIQNVHTGVGASSRRKVYVLDEVHMLTTEASNTLLKTLEEPPEHVVFVLATTDPQKVLPTIRSRTQHFDFTLLSNGQLVAHLAEICSRESVDADPDALDLVARRAAGSVRDALSLLDQALAIGAGRLDTEQVQLAFGGAPFEQRLAVLEAVAHEDVAGVLVGVHEMIAAGHDPRRITDDLVRTLRDAFVVANASGRVPYDGPAEESARLEGLAKEMGNSAIVRAIETLGQAIVDIRGQTVPDPRLVLEVALVRVARRDARNRDEALLERVERLEARLASGVPVAPPATAPAGAEPAARAARAAPRDPNGPLLARRPRAEKQPEPSDPPAPAAQPAAPPAPDRAGASAGFTLDDVVEAWPEVLGVLQAPVRSTVQLAQPIGVDAGVIVFGVPNAHLKRAEGKFRQEADAIKAAFADRLGGVPRFKLREHDFDAPGALAPGASDPAAGAAADAVVEDEPVDLSELVDARDAPAPSSVSRLVNDLGAEVVEERPR